MSFFSKLNKGFEDLMSDDKKKESSQSTPAPTAQRGYEQPNYSQPPQNQYLQYNTPPPNSQYGPPQGQQYPYPPQNSQYGAPQQQYGAPPQQYGNNPPHPQAGATVPPIPTVPTGWTPLWDPAGQRWAYLDMGSKVTWTLPTSPSYPGQYGDEGSRGIGGQSGSGGYGNDQYSSTSASGYQDQAAKDKEAKKKMMMGAAAGVAVGAIGGALLVNAMDDDDHPSGGGVPQGQQYPPGLDAPLPDETASGGSISSSDRESLEEAREEYREEYEEAYGSD